ncbi:MAG: hypothetical protein WCW04_01550 [Candidatus Paceibacterota bacterium]
MQPNVIQTVTQKPLFDPTYLNIEYFFDKLANGIAPVVDIIKNPNTWSTLGTISVLISMIFVFIIIFSIVRLYEIQVFDKLEIEHEINHALAKDKETDKSQNPRWKYILTLVESPNDSDWRIAIIEADSLLEESFKEKDLIGDNMSELLEDAKSNGYPSIQSAWDAHVVRNRIAHEGQEFSLTQIEARRVIKLYQNIFEDLNII